MRSQCLTSKMVYERYLPIYRLVSAVADSKSSISGEDPDFIDTK
jgi:hypothetical protein